MSDNPGPKKDVVAPNKLRFDPDGNVYFKEDIFLSYDDGVWYLNQSGTKTPYPTGFSLSVARNLQ